MVQPKFFYFYKKDFVFIYEIKIKKMKTNLFLIIFIVKVYFLSAQSNYFGAKASLSIPQLKGGTSELSRGYKSRMCANYGLFFTKEYSKHFALQIEALYASQGGVKKGIQLIPSYMIPEKYLVVFQLKPGEKVYAVFNSEAILNYLEIPLLLKYYRNFGKQMRIYTVLGPYVGILMNATYITSGESNFFRNNSQTDTIYWPMTNTPMYYDVSNKKNIRNELNKINYGVSFGFGFTEKYGPGDIIFDARVAYGLKNIQKDTEKNGKNNTGSIVISLGYAIQIGKPKGFN